MEKGRNQCLQLCQAFLKDQSDGHAEKYELEMEVRFHTKDRSAVPIPRLTQLDYERVIRKLRAGGYETPLNEGFTTLKIQPHSPSPSPDRGENVYKDLRVEIMGLSAIQEYCRTNDLNALMNSPAFVNQVKIRRKSVYIHDNNNATKTGLEPAEYDDFGFRITLMKEQLLYTDASVVADLRKHWADCRKTFRYMNRVSFRLEGEPLQVDLSIVKNSNYRTAYYTFSESKVLEQAPVYEMELEVLGKEARIQFGKNAEKMRQKIESVCLVIMAGIQGTNTPISYVEQSHIRQEYMRILFPEEAKKDPKFPTRMIVPKDFIGPSSRTLQIKHLHAHQTPNVMNGYVVTEKADGERRMLFVSGKKPYEGKIYYFSSNMEVMFSGFRTTNAKCYASLADGEYILHDKLGNYISKLMLFDMYYVGGVDIRTNLFLIGVGAAAGKKAQEEPTRYQVLVDFVSQLNQPKIQVKQFYGAKEGENIFMACANIFTNIYEYHTDGIIFTPQRLGVGASVEKKAGPLKKLTWEESFKWKPASQNTIDFLVITEKEANSGKDKIYTLYDTTSILYYKMLILHCGFDPKRDMFVNPCSDIERDLLPSQHHPYPHTGGSGEYQAFPFYPTDPADRQAGLAKIMLTNEDMLTEEGQVFTDKTIVEFRYDMDTLRWIPLRVRYDKTSEYRHGGKNFGNAFQVANDNWYSIHHPITPHMLTTGTDIPEIHSDVYYNLRVEEKRDHTRALRNFHNLFVKSLLIRAVSKRGDNLFDLACGKAGDLSKWVDNHLGFVLGMDISRDNLDNPLDGACSRFLNLCKASPKPPLYALFLAGNVANNIQSGEACLTDKGKQILQAVLHGKPYHDMGDGVKRQLGKGQEGFPIVSCQFAMHYFFQSAQTFYGFLRNVSENTQLGGYFIATCYDGAILYKRLWNTPKLSLYDPQTNQKIWEIVKEYDAPSKDFPENDNSLGLQISVYQSSIGQSLPEWLVSFPFLVTRMKEFGMELITPEQSKQLSPLLTSGGSGGFESLFNTMMQESKSEIRKKYGKASEMTTEEKEISFLNRYVIFQKVRTLDAKKLVQEYQNLLPSQLPLPPPPTTQPTQQAQTKIKPTLKKLNRKIKLK
jgi:hypothetical protein